MSFIKPITKIDLESRGLFKETLFPWSFYLISSVCWTKQVWNKLVILKGDRAKDASWSINLRNLNTCYSPHAWLGCCMNVYTKELLFLLRIWASQDAAMLLRSLLMKSRRLARGVFHTTATRTGLVHYVTVADGLPQNGSTHGRVLGTFRPGILTNMKRNQWRKTKTKTLLCVCLLLLLFVSPFLSTRPSCVFAPFPYKQRARH